MSQRLYNKKWRSQENHLIRILKAERRDPPDKNRDAAFATVSLRYVKYIQIYIGLQKCYDNMVHPQKRALIRDCVEGVAGRLIELRHEMIRLDLSTYSYLINIYHDLKMAPEDLVMELPKSVYLERVTVIRKRVQALNYILNTINVRAMSQSDDDVYTIEEAVLLIQKNQRGYMGRLRSKIMKKRKKIKNKGDKEPVKVNIWKVNVKGIIRFSSIWRGHQARKRNSSLRQEMDESLNMRLPKDNNLIKLRVHEESVKSQKFKDACTNEDNYKAELIIETEKMKEARGPDIAEAIKADILQWILECRSITGEFPQFPPPEKGGSTALYKNMSLTELEEDMGILENELNLAKRGVEAKVKKEEKKEPKKETKKNKKKDEIKEFIMKPSMFQDSLTKNTNEFSSVWNYRREDGNLIKQAHDHNLLMAEVEKNVETAIRTEIDELMREELIRLGMAIDNQKRPKPKKKKAPKVKQPPKKKTLKDLTPGVPIEDLFQELVLEGIIKKVPDVSLKDYVGYHNMVCSSDGEGIQTLPDLGDVRNLIFDLGILPMSSTNIHKKAPLVKSLLLVGPKCSGKKMLAHAICSELGANFFDLSPDNIVDKYVGKKGQQMLMHLVMKVGKEMEPSVIFIEESELMFTKKLTPEQKEMRPARMREDIMAALRVIQPGDRILLIGTSHYPYKAKMGPWLKMYQQLIMIYPPSHKTRYRLWETFIAENKGEINDKFSLTALAIVSKGYTAGSIYNSVHEVLTERRRSKMHIYPLKTEEFVKRLALSEPVFHSELEALHEWVRNTPLEKKRNRIEEIKAIGKENPIQFY